MHFWYVAAQGGGAASYHDTQINQEHRSHGFAEVLSKISELGFAQREQMIAKLEIFPSIATNQMRVMGPVNKDAAQPIADRAQKYISVSSMGVAARTTDQVQGPADSLCMNSVHGVTASTLSAVLPDPSSPRKFETWPYKKGTRFQAPKRGFKGILTQPADSLTISQNDGMGWQCSFEHNKENNFASVAKSQSLSKHFLKTHSPRSKADLVNRILFSEKLDGVAHEPTYGLSDYATLGGHIEWFPCYAWSEHQRAKSCFVRQGMRSCDTLERHMDIVY